MDREKLHKYALNQLTERVDIEEILSWINASEENKKEFLTLKNIWAMTHFANYDDISGVQPKKNAKLRVLSRNSFIKYAAIFILAFLVGSLSVYYISFKPDPGLTYAEIIVPAGESAEVVLPDNSHVWLNSSSKIVYPTQFNEKLREVKLEGEAYFEVARNEDLPFNVVTPNLTVGVLGTSFNVEAFPKNQSVHVTLVEGKVNLKDINGKILSGLGPGENAAFDLNKKKITISKVDTEYYTSWKEGMLLFENEKLKEIAIRFERWYNLDIQFEEEFLKEIEFTGTILKNKPIDQILDILKYTSGIDYSIEIKNNKPSIIYLKPMPM